MKKTGVVAAHAKAESPSRWFLLAVALAILLVGSAFWVAFLINPETRYRVVFDWEDSTVSVGRLSLTVVSAGPLTAGNPFHIETARFMIASPAPTGQVSFIIREEGSSLAGEIVFTLPRPVERADVAGNATSVYYATDDLPVGVVSPITPSRGGGITLIAHLSVPTSAETWQGWSHLTGPSLVVNEGFVPVGTTSDFYAFQGLRITASSILVAAAVAVPSALESFRNLKRADLAPKDPGRP